MVLNLPYVCEQYSNRVKLTNNFDPTIFYEFPVNPQSCTINIGQKTSELKLLGRDGSVIQTLGMNPARISLSGTIKDGVYYSKSKQYLKKADVVRDFTNMIKWKTVMVLTGIFTNFTGSMLVVVRDNNSLKFTAETPKTFSYTLDLIEWTDYQISGGQIQNVNMVAEKARYQLLAAMQRTRLRQGVVDLKTGTIVSGGT